MAPRIRVRPHEQVVFVWAGLDSQIQIPALKLAVERNIVSSASFLERIRALEVRAPIGLLQIAELTEKGLQQGLVILEQLVVSKQIGLASGEALMDVQSIRRPVPDICDSVLALELGLLVL